MLAHKQNEIFQISTRHKVSSAFRNDTLGIWFDAKAQLAQCFEEIKDKMFLKQSQAESLIGVPLVSHELSTKDAPTNLSPDIASFEQASLKQMKKI